MSDHHVMPALSIEEVDGCVRILAEQGQTIVLGRDPWRKIDPSEVVGTWMRVLRHRHMTWARRHATLTFGEAGCVIADNGSHCGIYINEQHIHAPTRLAPGDRLRIGSLQLDVRVAEGRTLGHRLTLAEGIACALAIDQQLERLHAAGFIHGDVLAHHILLDPSRGPLLLYPAEEAPVDAGLCRNPRHIAPERLQIDSVLGPAGDFYALGSVMFEAIAGRFPFPHETIPELLLKVVGGHGIEPEPDWPPVFTQILRELLEPDPELRLTSHAELRARLRGVLDTR